MAFTDRFTSLFSKETPKDVHTQSPDMAAINEPVQNKDYDVMAGILKKYNGSEREVTIPSNLGITSIGDRAFFRNNNITQVKIPKGITKIGNYAFSSCENLKHILFSDTVLTIGNYAFENCKNLEGFTLPDSVQSFGSYAFSGCSKLVSASLPDTLKTISNFSFNKCENLANIKIPRTVTNIGWSAFAGCSSLTYLNLPEKLTTIGNNAFQNCGFSKLVIPPHTTNIGEGAFFHCDKLEEISIEGQNNNFVTEDGVLFNSDKSKLILYPSLLSTSDSYVVPSQVKTICYGAFSNVVSLKNITLPDGLMKIDGCAFFHCINLSKIDIPDSVAIIGKSCFQKSSSLSQVTLPSQLQSIETGTFTGCEALEEINIPESVTNIGQIAFYGCGSLTSVTIPTNVTSINRDAFSHCNSLKYINIPASVSLIDRGAFSQCPFLTEFIVDENNREYATMDGVLFDKNMNIILSYPNGKLADAYTIPATVTRINDQAFAGSNNIVSLNIPKTVTAIGNNAFSECIKLTDVVIESGLTAIPPFAFSKCKNLSFVLLPASVTSIDSSSFVDCDKITFFCETSTYSYKFAMDNRITWSSMAPERVSDLQFVKGTHKSITITWREIPGKVEYNVYKRNSDGTDYDFIGKTTSNEITLDELKPGTFYTFRVAACRDFKGNKFPGTPSDDIVVTTNPDRVRNLVATANTLNSVMLSWDPVPNVIEYHIYKLDEEINEYEDIATSKSNKVLITGLVPDHDYQYKVMAYSMFNSIKLAGPFSDVISTGTSVGQITGLRCISSTSNSICLLWDEMNDASSYIVYEKDTETGEFVQLETTTRNTITFEDLTPGTIYSFKIAVTKIIDKKEIKSAPCKELTVSTSLNHVTGAIMASHSSTTIKLNWLKVNGATGYDVYVYNPRSDSFEVAGSTESNSIVFESLTPGTIYRYKIMAIREVDGEIFKGIFSSEIIADTLNA